MADTELDNGQLRSEDFDRMVKGFALREFVMKDLLMVNTSSAWVESYFRETGSDLTGGTGSAVRSIPRLSDFPYGEKTWTKVSAYIEKYGMECVISYEDILTANIDVMARQLLRVARAVSYAVDTQIYSVLSNGAGNSVAVAVGSEWDSATLANRDPIQNILNARRELSIDNFNPDSNGYLVLNPTDYAHVLGNSKVVNNPTFKTADVVSNGNVGKICGLTIKVSNVVSVSEALVVIAKECGTWRSAKGLTVEQIDNPGISKKIRAFELGVAQLTTPDAVCKITNTDA